MNRPGFFIVGAPRCGTTSLTAYLGSDPRIFMCDPKEPHHFGTDLDLRLRPYADQKRYLKLFERANGRLAGEASVMYLYSKTAPRDILALNPEARAIILLRDPIQMVKSLHSHNQLLGYENIADLREALAAEPERTAGRSLRWSAWAPHALRYSTFGRYSEHVERYFEAFGRERVLCLLFDDLRQDPAGTYERTLRFLGLEPVSPPPDFRVHNEQKQWKSAALGRVVMGTTEVAFTLGTRLPTRLLRGASLAPFALMVWAAARVGVRPARTAPMPEDVHRTLQAAFRDDVDRLARLLDRDLSAWLAPPGRAQAG